jgi:hypothetical protein
MTDTRPVQEHLRNSALYQPPMAATPGAEWKHRLYRQYFIGRQLTVLLQERIHLLKWFIYISIPVVCIALVFAAYFGFIHPGELFGSMLAYKKWNIPPVGLKEVFLLIAIVNGWVLYTRRRIFNL